MLPISIDAVPLVAGALLVVLALAVIVIWRSRMAEDRARTDDALDPSTAGVAWVADGADEPAAGADEPSVRRSTTARGQLDRAEREWEEFAAGWESESVPVVAAAGFPVQRTTGSGSVAVEPVRVSSSELRDRLLAVLLADREEAVRALDELAACQQRLATLSESTAKEHAVLDGIVARLATTGLRPEQLARLTDLPVTEVQQRLARTPATTSCGPRPA